MCSIEANAIVRRIVISALLTVASPILPPAFGDSTAKSSVHPEKIITLRSFGQVGIGGDDTAVFQRALSEASRKGQVLRIELSKVPYRVSPLYIPSNTSLVIDRGVVIQALPGFADGQKLITIGDAQNVRITGYGSTLKMNRSEYKQGEYRHCLYIIGSADVVIKGLSCLDAGGSGIYVGASERNPYSDNVVVEDVQIERSMGPGLDLISARNVLVRHSTFAYSSGPERPPGIAIRPNKPSARLQHVRLEENTTSANSGDGISFVLSRTNSTGTPIGIVVTGHHDKMAGQSSFSGADDPASGNPVTGSMLFENCSSEGAQQYGAVLSFWNSAGVRVVFRGLTVINPNESGSTMDGAGIAVKRGGGGVGTIGNVAFVRTAVKDTRSHPKLAYYFSFADYSNVGIRNVTFRSPAELTGALHKRPFGLLQGRPVDEIGPSPAVQVASSRNQAESHEHLSVTESGGGK